MFKQGLRAESEESGNIFIGHYGTKEKLKKAFGCEEQPSLGDRTLTLTWFGPIGSDGRKDIFFIATLTQQIIDQKTAKYIGEFAVYYKDSNKNREDKYDCPTWEELEEETKKKVREWKNEVEK